MPTIIQSDIVGIVITAGFLKSFILLILIFYAIFALILAKQIDLMGKTLMSNTSIYLKGFVIFHAGLSIGFIILAWGIL